MGRELRRVPLDFAWPLNKVWSGFTSDLERQRERCPTCSDWPSWSPAGYLIYALWYQHQHDVARRILSSEARIPKLLHSFADEVLAQAATRDRQGDRRCLGVYGGWGFHLDQGDVDALVQADRLSDFTRRQLRPDQETYENSRTKEPNGYHPTAAEVNAWARRGFGHDSINAHVCVRGRARRYRVAICCKTCHGSGHVANRSLSLRIHHWKPTDPPTGDGYQLWETVSEGSPISPVFSTPEALASWLVANSDGLDARLSYHDWLKFILGPGWAMSAVAVGGEVMSGVEAIVRGAA